jgi:hypothetical protein
MKKIYFPIFTVLSLIISSCGKYNKSSQKNTSQEFEEQQSQGLYKAILRPLNNHLSGLLPTGKAIVEIDKQQIQISTYLDDDAKVLHRQSIQDGTRCPSLNDDLNQDGILDFEEAKAIAGEVLIHLDGSLDGSLEGDGLYPWGSGFTYKKSANLSVIENEIRLRTKKNLDLAERVVMIYGVSKNTPLPETVATRSQLPKDSSIPVVCGVLKKIQL